MDKQKVQMGLCKINKMYKQAGKSLQTPTPLISIQEEPKIYPHFPDLPTDYHSVCHINVNINIETKKIYIKIYINLFVFGYIQIQIS